MNWLETHLRTFVFPQLLRYAKENGDTPPETNQLLPFTGKINPASGCMYEEFGLLKTFLKSTGLWERLVQPKFKVSAFDQIGIENFKRFKIETISTDGHHALLIPPDLAKFNANQIIHVLLKNSIRNLRGQNSRIIFLGRDVWPWYVVAQRIGLNSIFDPRVSRTVANNKDAAQQISQELGLQSFDVIFDTGFAGSIHRAFSNHTGLKLGNLMLSSSLPQTTQFPNATLARNRALFLEYLPKYFGTGRVTDGQIKQPLAPLYEFVSAAMLTIWAYKFVSPNFIEAPRVTPIKKYAHFGTAAYTFN